jgi:hypothetical protein
MAASQQALAAMVDRTQSYDQALVDERVPTRLGDGSVDVEVMCGLVSPFTGENRCSVDRANWIRQAEPGSTASILGHDGAGRALIEVGAARFTYGAQSGSAG